MHQRFTFFIRNLSGTTITLESSSEATIREVMQQIENQEQIPMVEQKIILAGRLIGAVGVENEAQLLNTKLKELNIVMASVVHLVRRTPEQVINLNSRRGVEPITPDIFAGGSCRLLWAIQNPLNLPGASHSGLAFDHELTSFDAIPAELGVEGTGLQFVQEYLEQAHAVFNARLARNTKYVAEPGREPHLVLLAVPNSEYLSLGKIENTQPGWNQGTTTFINLNVENIWQEPLLAINASTNTIFTNHRFLPEIITADGFTGKLSQFYQALQLILDNRLTATQTELADEQYEGDLSQTVVKHLFNSVQADDRSLPKPVLSRIIESLKTAASFIEPEEFAQASNCLLKLLNDGVCDDNVIEEFTRYFQNPSSAFIGLSATESVCDLNKVKQFIVAAINHIALDMHRRIPNDNSSAATTETGFWNRHQPSNMEEFANLPDDRILCIFAVLNNILSQIISSIQNITLPKSTVNDLASKYELQAYIMQYQQALQPELIDVVQLNTAITDYVRKFESDAEADATLAGAINASTYINEVLLPKAFPQSGFTSSM